MTDRVLLALCARFLARHLDILIIFPLILFFSFPFAYSPLRNFKIHSERSTEWESERTSERSGVRQQSQQRGASKRANERADELITIVPISLSPKSLWNSLIGSYCLTACMLACTRTHYKRACCATWALYGAEINGEEGGGWIWYLATIIGGSLVRWNWVGGREKGWHISQPLLGLSWPMLGPSRPL